MLQNSDNDSYLDQEETKKKLRRNRNKKEEIKNWMLLANVIML